MSGDVTDHVKAREGFTLIELLVVVAILALLIAILAPSLAAAHEESRSAVCRSNLRQVYLSARMYADLYRGWGPALGHPYAELPNWALVVQQYAAFKSGPGSRMFFAESLLVCPTIQRHYAEEMHRTYATNVTGHAGLPNDADNYDNPDAPPVHVRIDRIPRPADLPMVLDSARTSVVTDGPPARRTSSVIDFRQEQQVIHRVGWFHAGRQAFNAAMYDGSCYSWRRVPPAWETPLP